MDLLRAGIAVAAAAAVIGCLAAAPTARAGGGPGGGYVGLGRYPAEARALGWCNSYKRRPAKLHACLVSQTVRLLVRTGNPARELPRIDSYANVTGGYLDVHCHILMHTVGRRYGRIAHVTLERLRHYLPRSNDPGCSAGFAHGLLTYLGPQIAKAGPSGALAQCAKANTRYERYSCIHGLGHAYMRLFGETVHLALRWCRALGTANAVDCAQGAFHDYWIALGGYDNTRRPANARTSPRGLCGVQPARFVRACWYRALLERPPARAVRSARDVVAVCRGLRRLQLDGCITAASLIASSDAARQMQICRRLGAALALDCVRGVRTQSLAGAPLSAQVALIRGCSAFDRRVQSGCYAWLAKTLNVVRNGGFGFRGCPRVVSASGRAACYRGARSYRGPLETFS